MCFKIMSETASAPSKPFLHIVSNGIYCTKCEKRLSTNYIRRHLSLVHAIERDVKLHDLIVWDLKGQYQEFTASECPKCLRLFVQRRFNFVRHCKNVCHVDPPSHVVKVIRYPSGAMKKIGPNCNQPSVPTFRPFFDTDLWQKYAPNDVVVVMEPVIVFVLGDVRTEQQIVSFANDFHDTTSKALNDQSIEFLTKLIHDANFYISSIPGNLRSAIQTFQTWTEANGDSISLFRGRANLDNIVSELKALVLYLNLRLDFSLPAVIFRLVQEVPHSCVGVTVGRIPVLCKFVLGRMMKKDGSFVNVTIMSSRCSTILHMIRLMLVIHIYPLTMNPLMPIHSNMILHVQKSFFVNWISPLLCHLREVENQRPKRVYDVVTPIGDIVISGFVFPKTIWERLIYLWTSNCEDLLSSLFGQDIATTLITSDNFTVMDAKLLSWECGNFSSYSMKQKLLPGDHSLVLVQLASYLAMAFHGFGYGSMRYHELDVMEVDMIQFVDGRVWYWSSSRKRPSVRWGVNKLVNRRLPRICSRFYLIFLSVVESNGMVIPVSIEKFGIPWAMKELFGFSNAPKMLDIRHFWTEVTDIIMEPHFHSTSTFAATQCGHSRGTHQKHYSTNMVVSAQFDCYHEGLGDCSDDKNSIQIKTLDLYHCRRVLTTLYGKGAVMYPQQKVLLERILSKKRSILACVPCGFGKSTLFFVLALTQKLYGLSPGCIMVIVPYNFLLKHFVHRSEELGIDTLTLETHDIQSNICPPKLADGLPTLLFVTIEAFASLVNCGQFFDHWCSSGCIQRIFVDEIHTPLIEHGFRLCYESLRNIVRYKNIQVIGMSATLTPEVMEVLSSWLGMKDPYLLMPEALAISDIPIFVEHVDHIVSACVSYCRHRVTVGAIHIFPSTIDLCTSIFKVLKRVFERHGVSMITSKSSPSERERVGTDWSNNTIKVLVTTSCGLVGNENADCRTVIFLDSLYTIPSIVQGIGRIRPSQRQNCQVKYFYSSIKNHFLESMDIDAMFGSCNGHLKAFMSESRVYEFLTTTLCRYKLLSKFFGIQSSNCNICDNCMVLRKHRRTINPYALPTRNRSDITNQPCAQPPRIPRANRQLSLFAKPTSTEQRISSTITKQRKSLSLNPTITKQRNSSSSKIVVISQSQESDTDEDECNVGGMKMDDPVENHFLLLQQELKDRCVCCNKRDCNGERCHPGLTCFRCGSGKHRVYGCGDTVPRLLQNKACFGCYWIHPSTSHQPRHSPKSCPFERRFRRLIIQRYGVLPDTLSYYYSSLNMFKLFCCDLRKYKYQARHNSMESPPLLPPDYFHGRLDKGLVVERRVRWCKNLSRQSSAYRVPQSWTSTIDLKYVEVFDSAIPGCIQVTHDDGSISHLKWCLSFDEDFNRDLKRFVCLYRRANCRTSNEEPGGMCSVGRNSRGSKYAGTNLFDEIAESFGPKTSRHVQKHFPEEYETFLKRDQSSWKGFPTKRVVLSRNLMNSIHIDPNDTTVSLACFVACQKRRDLYQLLPDKKGWYLTFPHITRDGSRCIAIRIRNFSWICWDGRSQLHHTILESHLTKQLDDDNTEPGGYYSMFLGGS